MNTLRSASHDATAVQPSAETKVLRRRAPQARRVARVREDRNPNGVSASSRPHLPVRLFGTGLLLRIVRSAEPPWLDPEPPPLRSALRLTDFFFLQKKKIIELLKRPWRVAARQDAARGLRPMAVVSVDTEQLLWRSSRPGPSGPPRTLPRRVQTAEAVTDPRSVAAPRRLRVRPGGPHRPQGGPGRRPERLEGASSERRMLRIEIRRLAVSLSYSFRLHYDRAKHNECSGKKRV